LSRRYPLKPLRWWEQVLMWIGLVLGFVIFLTIPGWIGLASYRRWKRGEIERPIFPIVFGGILVAAWAAAIVAVFS
jgi:hypothetical protein